MSESYPLFFSKVDQAKYEKLDAAVRDLKSACVRLVVGGWLQCKRAKAEPTDMDDT